MVSNIRNGLVLEGGGMRGMYTVGVLDEMMEAGVRFDGLVGVSAGACFGCNYKSHQIGRALRYNKQFAADPRYMGIRSLIRTGNYINADFAYHIVPTEHDVFDGETFRRDPMEFHLVCTDVTDGRPVYMRFDHVDYEMLEGIRATSSMPGVSRPVRLRGHELLDGGISDSIPLRYFQEQGFNRNVVILTQPADYRKSYSRAQNVLLRIFARRYPAIIHAMSERATMYNEQLDYVAQEQAAGRAFVICPEASLGISRVGSNPDELQRVYDIGRAQARCLLPKIIDFISK